MSDDIKNTKGDVLVTLEPGSLNTDLPLTLIGAGASDFVQAFNENLVRLLENFASSEAPANPLPGQLWFDDKEADLKLWNGSDWAALGAASATKDSDWNGVPDLAEPLVQAQAIQQATQDWVEQTLEPYREQTELYSTATTLLDDAFRLAAGIATEIGQLRSEADALVTAIEADAANVTAAANAVAAEADALADLIYASNASVILIAQAAADADALVGQIEIDRTAANATATAANDLRAEVETDAAAVQASANAASVQAGFAAANAVAAIGSALTAVNAATFAAANANIAASNATLSATYRGRAESNATVAYQQATYASANAVLAQTDATLAAGFRGAAQANAVISQQASGWATANASLAQTQANLSATHSGHAAANATVSQQQAAYSTANAAISLTQAGLASTYRGQAATSASIANQQATYAGANASAAQASAGLSAGFASQSSANAAISATQRGYADANAALSETAAIQSAAFRGQSQANAAISQQQAAYSTANAAAASTQAGLSAGFATQAGANAATAAERAAWSVANATVANNQRAFATANAVQAAIDAGLAATYRGQAVASASIASQQAAYSTANAALASTQAGLSAGFASQAGANAANAAERAAWSLANATISATQRAYSTANAALSETAATQSAAFRGQAESNATIASQQATFAGANASMAAANAVLSATHRGHSLANATISQQQAAYSAANAAISQVQAGLASTFRGQAESNAAIASQQATYSTANAALASTQAGLSASFASQAGANAANAADRAAWSLANATISSTQRAYSTANAALSQTSATQSAAFRGQAESNAVIANQQATYAGANATAAQTSADLSAGFASASQANASISQQQAAYSTANAATASTQAGLASTYRGQALANASIANQQATYASANAVLANDNRVLAVGFAAQAGANAAAASDRAAWALANATIASQQTAYATANASIAFDQRNLAVTFAGQAQSNATASSLSRSYADANAALSQTSASLSATHSDNARFADTAFVSAFANVTDGWVLSGGNTTVQPDHLFVELTAGNNGRLVKATSFEGSRFTRIVVDLERVTNRTGGAWEGRLYYATAGHAYGGTHYKIVPDTLATGVRSTLTFDMTNLTVGGDDWVTNTITGLRLDLETTTGGTYKIYSIRVIGPDNAAIATTAANATTQAGISQQQAAFATANAAAANDNRILSANFAGQATASANVASTQAAYSTANASIAFDERTLTATHRGYAQSNASAISTLRTYANDNAVTAQAQSILSASFAAQASASADAIQNIAYQLLPDRVSRAADFTNTFSSSNPPETVSTLWAGTVVTVSGEGDVRQFTDIQNVTTKGGLIVRAGDTYRLNHRSRVTVDAVGSNRIVSWFRVHDASWAYLGVIGGPLDTSHVEADGWQTLESTTTGDAILAAHPTAFYIRANVRGGDNGSTASSGATWQLASLSLRNTTSEVRAAANAALAEQQAVYAAANAALSLVQRNLTANFAGQASTSANVASMQAAYSTANASAAQVSMTLAASVAASSLNSNPVFADYPTTPGVPTGWVSWTNGAGGTRVAGMSSAYAFKLAGAASTNNGIMCGPGQNPVSMGTGTVRPDTYWVIEADVTLNTGSLTGAGVALYAWSIANAGLEWLGLTFATDPDSTGAVIGSGTTGRTYRYSKLVKVTHADASRAALYVASHHTNFGATTSANDITFHKALVRPATEAEIEVGIARGGAGSLGARLTEQANAIATLDGYSTARWQITANAVGASAFITAQAETSPGVVTSNVALGGRNITLYNPVGEEWVPALTVQGGDVILSGGLQTGAFIRFGSGGSWAVAYQPQDFVISDGTVVSFGADLGQLPQLTFSTLGLAPLSTGETYNLYADSLTSTGFTARLKIATPGTPSSYTLTTDTTPGSGPTRQIDKGSNPDATSNQYTLTISGQQTWQTGNAPESEMIEVSGSVTCKVYAKVANTWSEAGTITSYNTGTGYGTGELGTPITIWHSWEKSETMTLPSSLQAVGVTYHSRSGGNSGSLTDFDSLIWTAPGSESGTRSATPSGQATTVTVRPRN